MHAVRTWIAGAALIAAFAALAPIPAAAQTNPGTMPPPTPAGDGTFLLTIFLKHDQSKPLPKIASVAPCASNEPMSADGPNTRTNDPPR